MSTLVGIDEVGRGSLAGDMYIGVCLIDESSTLFPIFSKFKIGKNLNLLLDKKKKVYVRDSKKLTSKQRERAMLFLRDKVSYGVVKISVLKIEKDGLSRAFKDGVKKILEWVRERSQPKQTKVFVDGITTLDDTKKLSVQFIKKADNSIPIVAAASIFAKVTRDSYMKKLHLNFPMYNWKNNVGYGTKEHIEAIKKYGVTKYHRMSFLKKILKLH